MNFDVVSFIVCTHRSYQQNDIGPLVPFDHVAFIHFIRDINRTASSSWQFCSQVVRQLGKHRPRGFYTVFVGAVEAAFGGVRNDENHRHSQYCRQQTRRRKHAPECEREEYKKIRLASVLKTETNFEGRVPNLVTKFTAYFTGVSTNQSLYLQYINIFGVILNFCSFNFSLGKRNEC